MKFVDRKNELEFLNKEYSKEESSLIILYGRRRIGKTSLIKEFGKSKNMPEPTIEKENKPKDHIYTEKEMQWLYDNQDKLDQFQEKVLNAGMWVRAMHANYHGYAKRWPNISVENGEIFYYGNNGELKRVPFNKDM